MANFDLKPWMWIAGIIFIAFVLESGMFTQEQSSVQISEENPSFQDTATQWWNNQGELAQNVIIWGVGGIVFIMLLFAMVSRGGGR